MRTEYSWTAQFQIKLYPASKPVYVLYAYIQPVGLQHFWSHGVSNIRTHQSCGELHGRGEVLVDARPAVDPIVSGLDSKGHMSAAF